MRPRALRLIVPCAVLLLVGACTWVRPVPGAEAVRLLEPEEAMACARVGEISATSRERVAGVRRGIETLREELRTLARNEAVALGADAILPAGPIEGGRQRFVAFDCP